jgi:hypothetical protein
MFLADFFQRAAFWAAFFSVSGTWTHGFFSVHLKIGVTP